MKFAYIPMIIAATLITACEKSPQDATMTDIVPEKTVSAPLWHGEWVSTEDWRATLQIEPETIQFGYDGTGIGTRYYSIEKGCPDHPELSFDGPTIVTTTVGEKFCYAIDSASETRLVLIYVPRGNALEYTRNLKPTSR